VREKTCRKIDKGLRMIGIGGVSQASKKKRKESVIRDSLWIETISPWPA
jgi:hypothetical protein